MNNSKNTRRALVTSGISIALSAAMMMGSTFAWFTDSAKVDVNMIQSGNLHVDLVDENGASLVGSPLNFVDLDNNAYWEPGCTYELPAVYVKNDGNLALKYQLEVSGFNGDAKLLEAIEFTVDGQEISTYTGNVAAGEMSSEGIVIKAHMKEEASNEYQDLTAEGVAITVVATQDTVESDSYNNTYDANAALPTIVSSVEELKTALTSGKTVVLSESVDLDEQVTLNGATLNGNGNTINSTVPRNSNGNSVPAILATEGTIENISVIGDGRGVGTMGALTGDLTVNNYKADGGSYALHVGKGNGHSLTVNNSELYGWTSYGTGFSSVEFNGCTFGEATTGSNFVRAYSDTTFSGCEFSGTALDLDDTFAANGGVITLENCTFNGVAIDESNLSSLLNDASEAANIVIK